ncbi:MAG TPA: hypothetical protein PLX16_05210 [Exilispira sp.]|nr:hypothetical protein [Exilispira sp.]
MISCLGVFDSNRINDLTDMIGKNLEAQFFIIFYIKMDEIVREISSRFKNIVFIKIDYIFANGYKNKDGFIVYQLKKEPSCLFLDSNPDLIAAKLGEQNFKSNSAVIFSNVLKKDEGNNLIFFLYNIFGMDSKLIGFDFDNVENAIYYQSKESDYYFILFEIDENIDFEYDISFWEDYEGPFLITGTSNGYFKSILWQNAVQFFHEKLSNISLKDMQENIKFFPLKVQSLKDTVNIIRLKLDFGLSLENIYEDISIFSYQYGYIEKLNSSSFRNSIRKFVRYSKNNFVTFSSDLINLLESEQMLFFRLQNGRILKKLVCIPSNLLVFPTESTPSFTSNCMVRFY